MHKVVHEITTERNKCSIQRSWCSVDEQKQSYNLQETLVVLLIRTKQSFLSDLSQVHDSKSATPILRSSKLFKDMVTREDTRYRGRNQTATKYPPLLLVVSHTTLVSLSNSFLRAEYHRVSAKDLPRNYHKLTACTPSI